MRMTYFLEINKRKGKASYSHQLKTKKISTLSKPHLFRNLQECNPKLNLPTHSKI
jgi:hypothetical protein